MVSTFLFSDFTVQEVKQGKRLFGVPSQPDQCIKRIERGFYAIYLGFQII